MTAADPRLTSSQLKSAAPPRKSRLVIALRSAGRGIDGNSDYSPARRCGWILAEMVAFPLTFHALSVQPFVALVDSNFTARLKELVVSEPYGASIVRSPEA